MVYSTHEVDKKASQFTKLEKHDILDSRSWKSMIYPTYGVGKINNPTHEVGKA
ncbi:hypothetical protein SESBI_33042 [Sesbania bispinosa]|nr:hypothetical protein SESBI_33042 [Sesbania bispinosa]